MNNETFRKEIAKQCGFETEAIQASEAGNWPSEQVEKRVYDGEDIEAWQEQSERQGAE